MEKILNDDTSIKFIDLLSTGKIEVYAFRNQLELMDKGYTVFFK